MHNHHEQESEHIDQNMEFSAHYPLPGVKASLASLAESATLKLWLSIIAADGWRFLNTSTAEIYADSNDGTCIKNT
jgi:hypothetical protein